MAGTVNKGKRHDGMLDHQIRLIIRSSE